MGEEASRRCEWRTIRLDLNLKVRFLAGDLQLPRDVRRLGLEMADFLLQ
jgi:hypothetical protein